MLHKIINYVFLDKNGHIVIGQFPNVPIAIWAGSIILNKIVASATWSTALSTIGTTALAVWAFLELVSGVNHFRKFLGFITLLYIFSSLFI